MSKEEFAGKTFNAPKERCGRLTEMILQYVDPSRPLRVLDLGCGTGEQLFDLAKALPYADLVGVDISHANIQVAKKTRNRLSLGGRLSFNAIDYMDFRVDPFGLILSDSTLQNISIPTKPLFSKIGGDLVSGGLLLTTMPYACIYNRFLWTIHRFFLIIRSPLTDTIILVMGKCLHGSHFQEELLREHIPYMHLLPKRYDCHTFRQFLSNSCGLEFMGEHPVPHLSIDQPKHGMTVFRKRKYQ